MSDYIAFSVPCGYLLWNDGSVITHSGCAVEMSDEHRKMAEDFAARTGGIGGKPWFRKPANEGEQRMLDSLDCEVRRALQQFVERPPTKSP
jgi:hypothetical protein